MQVERERKAVVKGKKINIEGNRTIKKKNIYKKNNHQTHNINCKSMQISY